MIESLDVKTSRNIISGARSDYHLAATIYLGFLFFILITTHHAYVAFHKLLLAKHSYLVSSSLPS